MEPRSNFEHKMHEMFQEKTIPLKNYQWERMEKTLLEQKKARKRKVFWIFGTVFLGFAFFGMGYFASQWTGTKNSLELANANELTHKTTEKNNEVTKPSLKDNLAFNPTKHSSIVAKENNASNTNKLVYKIQNTTPTKNTSIENYNAINLISFIGLEGKSASNLLKFNSNSIKPIESSFVLGGLKENQSFINAPPYVMPTKSFLLWCARVWKNNTEITLGAGTSWTSNKVEAINSKEYLTFDYQPSIQKQMSNTKSQHLSLIFNTRLNKNWKIGYGFGYFSQSNSTSFTYLHNMVPFFDSSLSTVLGFIKLDDSIAPKSEININNKVSAFQIPLQLSFDKIIKKNWSIGGTIGSNITLPHKTNIKFYDVLRFKYKQLDNESFGMSNAYFTQINLKRKIVNGVWLGLNYQLQSSRSNLDFINKPTQIRHLNHGFNFTLSYQL